MFTSVYEFCKLLQTTAIEIGASYVLVNPHQKTVGFDATF